MFSVSRRRVQASLGKRTAFLEARAFCRGVHDLYRASNQPDDRDNKAAFLKSLARDGVFGTFVDFDAAAREEAARAGANDCDLVFRISDECIGTRANDVWAIRYSAAEHRQELHDASSSLVALGLIDSASAQPSGLPVIGTNRTGSVPSVSVPVAVRRRIRSSWLTVPTGIAITPPIFSCCTRAAGTSSGAAVTMMRSYGACSGQPR